MNTENEKTLDITKLIIHDLDSSALTRRLQKDAKVIFDDGTIHKCTGCFGCWVKTPGKCVIGDNYQNMGANLAKYKELIIISNCCYGGPSPFVKNVLDRSIPYVHPNFVIRHGEMHHKQRYHKSLILSVFFYGIDLSAEEKQTAEEWVNAMAKNFYCDVKQVVFLEQPSDLEVLF